jgi:transmembrane sensor
MDDLANRLAALRERMNPPWDEARSKRVQLGVARLQRRRRAFLVASTATCASIAVFGIGYSLLRWQSRDDARAASEPAAAQAQQTEASSLERHSTASAASMLGALPSGAPVRLADGSEATLASPDGQLFLEVNRAEQIRLRLAAGSAHFEVVPNTQRQFSVLAGSIEVVVVGTAFDVQCADNRARVAVTHGKVRVRSAAGVAYVQAGEERWFEPRRELLAEPHAERSNSGRAPASPPAKREAARRVQALPEETARSEWRRLNRRGDYQAAYALLERGAAVDDNLPALMEAADTARLTDHLDTAVRYLRRAVTDHRHDPATPLAAFTLGRLLLGQLDRPREAAEAFATVRELGPEGGLAQDALAREVEAWSKAGKIEEARVRAQLFIRNYPQSRRRPSVEVYGGLRAE